MIKKLFREMLVTQIVSTMTVTLCMLIDSIMIGRFLGVDSMSAYGFATPLLLVFAALGSMISAGVQIVCGKTIGNGDREGTDACYTAAMFLSAVISAVGLILVFSLLKPLTRLLGAGTPSPDNPVAGLTTDYIKGFILGAPAFLCAQIMVPFLQLSGKRMRLIAAVVAMTVSDIIFDLLNVFVFHGGTFGMGLASTLSYYIALAIGLLYFFRKDCLFRFRFRLMRRRVFKELISYGVPTVINQISTVLLVLLLNRLLEATANGMVAVAAYSVITTVGNICYCFGTGIGSVAMMLASVFYTDRDRKSICELVRLMTFHAILLDLAVMAIMLLVAVPLVTLFLGDSTEAVRIAASGFRLFVLSLVPSSLNSAFKNYYQGVDRIGFAELISVLQNFVFPALFAFVLSRFLDITGIWLGFLCGETLALAAFSIVVWRCRGRVTLSADAYSMLKPGFGTPEKNCFERSIRSEQDAIDASKDAVAFCRSHGLSRRESMLIGLCVEEMTVNIVTYGFRADRKKHHIDIRLVLENGDRVLRIRDDCVNFDPVHYLELHESDDPTAHVGIRMVMKAAKDANYLNSLGLNNLTLVF
jgi:putative MATE family efflux protein